MSANATERVWTLTDGANNWSAVPCHRIEPTELRVGDLVASIHSITTWRVEFVSQYVAWASVRGELITSMHPENHGRVDGITVTHSAATVGCYRPITEGDES